MTAVSSSPAALAAKGSNRTPFSASSCRDVYITRTARTRGTSSRDSLPRIPCRIFDGHQLLHADGMRSECSPALLRTASPLSRLKLKNIKNISADGDGLISKGSLLLRDRTPPATTQALLAGPPGLHASPPPPSLSLSRSKPAPRVRVLCGRAGRGHLQKREGAHYIPYS
jgi:hypothetical protein